MNQKVSLYSRTRSPKTHAWKYTRVRENQLSKLRVIEEGEGYYALSWYEGKVKRFVNVGRFPEEVRTAFANRLNGKKVEQPVPSGLGRRTLSEGIAGYFRELHGSKGRDGIGFSGKTLIAYKARLAFFQRFCEERGLVYTDAITRDDLLGYVEWLRDESRNLSDRSVHNIFSALRSLLVALGAYKEVLSRGDGVNLGKPIKLDFMDKPVNSYSKEQLEAFFRACDPDQKLVFTFFLNSGCREAEVANTETADLDFKRNVLHVQGKANRGFRTKGKEDRFVPLPESIMAKLKVHCKNKASHDLLFPNRKTGGVEGHFLRQVQQVAKRAGLDASEFNLHRFRRTFATIHHEENGVSVNTLRGWLGHKDINTTLRYLESSSAAAPHIQEKVNSGMLAAFV